MSEPDADKLRKYLLNADLPGVAYMLIWGDLDEASEAYAELQDVLFDGPSEDAPCRDLSDPKVRAGVTECALKYPEIAAAVRKQIRRLSRPWWKFW